MLFIDLYVSHLQNLVMLFIDLCVSRRQLPVIDTKYLLCIIHAWPRSMPESENTSQKNMFIEYSYFSFAPCAYIFKIRVNNSVEWSIPSQ